MKNYLAVLCLAFGWAALGLTFLISSNFRKLFYFQSPICMEKVKKIILKIGLIFKIVLIILISALLFTQPSWSIDQSIGQSSQIHDGTDTVVYPGSEQTHEIHSIAESVCEGHENVALCKHKVHSDFLSALMRQIDQVLAEMSPPRKLYRNNAIVILRPAPVEIENRLRLLPAMPVAGAGFTSSDLYDAFFGGTYDLSLNQFCSRYFSERLEYCLSEYDMTVVAEAVRDQLNKEYTSQE